jgi:hypothetical protein
MTTIEKKYQEKCSTPSDISEHLPTLRRYAGECQNVTELGVRAVVSTWAFLAGLSDSARRDMKYPKRLLSVDIARPENHGGNLAEVFAAAEGGITFLFLEADDRKIELAETDLLFIDTWHAYEQLKAELDLHGNKARKFIILHDTETFGEHGEKLDPLDLHGNIILPPPCGLKQAVVEFLLDNPEWRVREHFKNNNGLTVLERDRP